MACSLNSDLPSVNSIYPPLWGYLPSAVENKAHYTGCIHRCHLNFSRCNCLRRTCCSDNFCAWLLNLRKVLLMARTSMGEYYMKRKLVDQPQLTHRTLYPLMWVWGGAFSIQGFTGSIVGSLMEPERAKRHLETLRNHFEAISQFGGTVGWGNSLHLSHRLPYPGPNSRTELYTR